MSGNSGRGGGKKSKKGLAQVRKGNPRGQAQTQRVRTARGRKTSSTLWLKRQLNDPYVAEAQRRGYRSRAAFKLLQLDEKFDLLKPGQRVVDLGAAPGGWTQIAVDICEPEERGGKVIGLDILEMEPLPGATTICLDFLDDSAPDRLIAELGGQKADLVISDMAPPTIGHQSTDHLRIMALVEAAWMFAEDVLTPGGSFVAKVFQGGAQDELLAQMKQRMSTIRHFKPDASRKSSSETYLVATGFKG
ncbi:MAG: RlmE family RNA methyltransferase [Alphaproteobacteria bacterium]